MFMIVHRYTTLYTIIVGVRCNRLPVLVYHLFSCLFRCLHPANLLALHRLYHVKPLKSISKYTNNYVENYYFMTYLWKVIDMQLLTLPFFGLFNFSTGNLHKYFSTLLWLWKIIPLFSFTCKFHWLF